MTKKKPDFLRDLDTAIMDELTGGGIKENAAGLVGTLTQIKEIKQLCGLPFCGYMAKLETVRPSGVPDEVTVVFAEDVPYRACNGMTDKNGQPIAKVNYGTSGKPERTLLGRTVAGHRRRLFCMRKGRKYEH